MYGEGNGKGIYVGRVESSQDGKSCGACSFGGSTLSKALQNAFRTSSYYLALGRQVQVSEIKETCPVCHERGYLIAGKRVQKRKPCRNCKGQGYLRTLTEPFPAQFSSSIEASIPAAQRKDEIEWKPKS
jgi:hypothetical protein